MKCSRCSVTFYCSRECQVDRWKKGDHKQECGEITASSAGIKLSSDDLEPELIQSSRAFTNEDCFWHSYQLPENVKVREKFIVAVHCESDNAPLLIRDESSTCQFQYKPTGPGYAQMLKEVRKQPIWGGKKTYMKAYLSTSQGSA